MLVWTNILADLYIAFFPMFKTFCDRDVTSPVGEI